MYAMLSPDDWFFFLSTSIVTLNNYTTFWIAVVQHNTAHADFLDYKCIFWQNHQVNEVGLLSGCARKSDAEHQTKILEERWGFVLHFFWQPYMFLYSNFILHECSVCECITT